MHEEVIDREGGAKVGAGDVEIEGDVSGGVLFSEVEDDGYDFVGCVFVNVFSNHHDAVAIHSGVDVDKLGIV